MEFHCSACDYKSYVKKAVERHLTRQKPCGTGIREVVEIPIEIKCDNCNKNFSTMASLTEHKKSHCKKKDQSVSENIKDIVIIELKEEIDALKTYIEKTTLETEKEDKKDNKRTRINAVLRQAVWHNNIGKKIGCIECPCCHINEITQMNFAAGHVISVKNGGGDNIDNLLPICTLCNSSMGPMNMDDFIEMNNKMDNI
jgi:hypothetical protein